MIPTAVVLISCFWASLFLLDSFLKSSASIGSSYLSFLNRSGLSVSFGQVRWFTTRLNRSFVRYGTSYPRFLSVWFTAGVVFGCISMVMSQVLLVAVIVNKFSQKPAEEQVLVPVMPGVNLPMNQIGYYLLTLFVCGVFHEVGHAVAAVREKVRVNGFGVFAMAIYPGAFVDISTEHLQSASPLQQLRIYCAGVWHNFVIVLLAFLALVSLPTVIVPFYSSGQAAFVTYVSENSPVAGARGFDVGDRVTSIDGCNVSNVNEWAECIRQSLAGRQHGYCLPLDVLHQQDTSMILFQFRITVCDWLWCMHFEALATVVCMMDRSEKCRYCDVGRMLRKRQSVAFVLRLQSEELFERGASRPSIITAISAYDRVSDQKYACLPARSTSERQSCASSADCQFPPFKMACVTPIVDNATRLMRLERQDKPAVLFYGQPTEIYFTVITSDYTPRWSWLPVNLYYICDTFCRYLVSLSGALAVLNAVPCYALDGQWSLLALFELLYRFTGVDRRTCNFVYTLFLCFGTATLFTNIVIALWTLSVS